MSEPIPPHQGRQIERVAGGRIRWPLAASAGVGLLGILEVVVVYLSLMSRLPAEVPDHFGVTGQADGTVPPVTFLETEVGVIVLISTVFFLLLWRGSRSPALSHHHRRTFEAPVLVIQGTISVAIVPAISTAVLASAAGVWSVSGQELGVATLLIGLVPVAVILLVLLTYGRVRLPQVPPLHSGAAPAPAFLGVGGPIELACSSCGEAFQLSGVPLLAPHMGIAGKGSLYVRCPRCGERGWDPVVGHVRS